MAKRVSFYTFKVNVTRSSEQHGWGVGRRRGRGGGGEIQWQIQPNGDSHDSHALGVDGRQVCIFKDPNQVGLGSLLHCQKGVHPEAHVGRIGAADDLRDFTHEALEGQLPQQQIR